MRILAIGGGSKRAAIEQALDGAGEEQTRLLIVPTACSTAPSYNRKLSGLLELFTDLGVTTSVLHESGVDPTPTQIAEELGRATAIFTMGGNTPHMMRVMDRTGLGSALAAAILDDKTHMGVSAGALLPFTTMHSNVASRPELVEWDFEFLPGLDVVHAAAAVHANKHDPTPNGLRPDSRLDHFVAHFPAEAAIGVALDNNAAIILGRENQVVLTDPAAQVHLLVRGEHGVSVQTVEDPAQLSVITAA